MRLTDMKLMGRCTQCHRYICAPELRDIAEPVKGYQAIVLRDLVDRPVCSYERLINQCYSDDPAGGPQDAAAIIKTLIYTIRKKLKHGWAIVSENKSFRLEKRI